MPDKEGKENKENRKPWLDEGGKENKGYRKPLSDKNKGKKIFYNTLKRIFFMIFNFLTSYL